MREVYLLAASLLTGLAVPDSTLPHLLIIQPASYTVVWNLKDSSQHIGESNFEISLPDLGKNSGQVIAEVSFKENTPIVTPQFISGSQLYYQRLAAVKVGKIYTSLDEDDLSQLQVKTTRHQLSYQDWKNLLSMEATAIAHFRGANRLSILVGDSLSMWFPREKMPTGKLWLNQGISGDTSSGVLKRLSAFSETKPDVIYIMAGINDLRNGATDQTILHNHRLILRRLRRTHPQTQIFLQSILPTRLPTISNNRIRQINHQLALIAQQEGAKYLDLHHWFTDFQGNLREDYTTDGLHLSKEGYGVWSSTLQQIESKSTLPRITPDLE